MSERLARGATVNFAGVPTRVLAVISRPGGTLHVDLENDRSLRGPAEYVFAQVPVIGAPS